MSRTGRAGLTTQLLPRVSGDTVGFISTHFKHLEGRFQPSIPPVFIVFVIFLHREVDTTTGQLIWHIHLRCLLEDRRNHLPQGAWLILATPAATIQLQTSGPVSPILMPPSQIRHWPPTGRTWACWLHILLCPMHVWNVSGHLLNT